MSHSRTIPFVLLATTAWNAGCGLSHAPGEAEPGTEAPVAADCARAVSGPGPSESEARAIAARLQHEVGHTGERVLEVFAGGPVEEDGSEVSLSFLEEEDGGGYIDVVGTPADEDGLPGADLDVTFRRWSGRHGGFGPVALDGHACVRLLVMDSTPGAESFYAEVEAAVGLAGGGAFSAAPAANARYAVLWEGGIEMDVIGTIAGYDLASLSTMP